MAENLQPTVEIEDTPQGNAPGGFPSGDATGTAAQQTAQPAQQQPPQQQPVMGCTGDCKRCHEVQRGYCASQIAYNMQNAVARIENMVAAFAQSLASIGAKVEVLQAQINAQRKPNEGELFTPEQPTKTGKKK